MKTFFLRLKLLICFTSISSSLFAQPAIEWDKTIGGSADDRLLKSISTEDGGYLLAGYSSSGINGDKTSTSRGGTDFWVVKILSDGTKAWDKSYGGSGSDILVDIIATADGNFMLAGNSTSSAVGDKTETSRGNEDYWIVKIDNNGNKLWDKTFGGNSWDKLVSVRQTPDGGYILAGSSNSDISGDKSQNKIDQGEDGRDMWLVKTSGNGKLEWEKTMTTNSGGEIKAFAVASDNGFIVGLDQGGFEQSFGRFYVIKYNSSAEVQWENLYGDEGSFNRISTITPTTDGGYILGGFMKTTDGGSPVEYLESDDLYLVKINSTGLLEWEKVYGSVDSPDGNYNEKITSVVQTASGGYIVGGVSNGLPGTTKTENSRGGLDFWILRLQRDGDVIWDKTIGGSGEDQLQCISISKTGQFLLSGYSRSPRSGEKSANSNGNFDFWIVKMFVESEAMTNQFSGFSVTKSADAVTLQWSIMPRHNFTTFAIEYTTDRQNWGTVTIKSVGGSLSFQYTHATPPTGSEVLYRIRAVKQDYSSIVSRSRSVIIPVASPEIKWDKIFGGPGVTKFNIMVKTSDGGFLLGGASENEVGMDKTEPGRGGEDYWILKVSGDGTRQWDKTFGGPANDFLQCIIQTDDSGFLLGGTSYSNAGGDKSENDRSSAGGAGAIAGDYWVIKVDAAGNKIWDKTIGGNKEDIISGIVPSRDGGYIFTGMSRSDIGSEKTVPSTPNSSDVWFVKLSNSGEKVWDRIHSEQYRAAPILTIASDGGYILGTQSAYYDDFKYTLAKLTDNFSIQWTKVIADNVSFYNSLKPTSDGGYVVGGYSRFFQEIDKIDGSRGKSDYRVVKVSYDGSPQWAKTLGSNRYDVLYSVEETSDKGFLLAGYSNSLAQWDKTEDNKGYRDYWLVKLRSDGTKHWDKVLGGANNDELRFAFEAADHNFVLAGLTNSQTGGDISAPTIQGENIWMVGVASTEPPLPVSLLDFTVSKEEKIALLTWQTSSEFQSNRFEVEQSLDAKVWISIANLNAKGSSNRLESYQFTHINPAVGDNYYRLKMVDTDGSFTYSKIERVRFDLGLDMLIYPNPAIETFNLQAMDWSKVKGLQILSNQGETLYRSGNKPSQEISVKTFKPGIYFIKITFLDGKEAIRKIAVGQ